MHARLIGLVRFVGLLALFSLVVNPLAQVAAQDATPADVEGATYTSPTFGYTFSWDDSIWGVSDDYSEDGYDSLTLAADDAALYIEAFYFYQGNAADCLDGERLGIAQDAGLDDLAPITDANGTHEDVSSAEHAMGMYELPATDANDGVESVVYLQCQTLIPGAVVLVITAFLDPSNLPDQIGAIADVIATLDTSASAEPEFGSGDLEGVVQQTGVDVDGFWSGVFDDLGSDWVNPKFITFGETIETGCGDAVPEDSGPFYCPEDQTVYLDAEEMTNEMLPFGIVVVDVMLAHEIGHHVQNLLDLDGCTETECGVAGASLAIELQADCLAGAWMQDAAARGVVSDRDLKRVEIGVRTYFGDPPGTSQDDPDAHGSGETRFTIFMDGYTDGISACGIG